MRFFTEEVLDALDNGNDERFCEARELNHIEYLKAKKRLPKKFAKIYEKTWHFDDDLVPYISIVSQYSEFTRRVKKLIPSVLRMIIVDYDNLDLAWEIIISDIKEMTARWVIINVWNSRKDCFALMSSLLKMRSTFRGRYFLWED